MEKRIRTVKNEIRLKLWYEEQAQKQLMPKQPTNEQTIDKDDQFKRNLSEFIITSREVESNITSSVEIGLQKALQRKKQKQEEQQQPTDVANVVVCDSCGTRVKEGSSFFSIAKHVKISIFVRVATIKKSTNLTINLRNSL